MLPSSSALAGPSNASISSDTYEQTLTQGEYDTKMREHRQPTAPSVVATRPYGDGVVVKYNWLPALVPLTPTHWLYRGHARLTMGSGNGTYLGKGDRKLMKCNAHVDCP